MLEVVWLREVIIKMNIIKVWILSIGEASNQKSKLVGSNFGSITILTPRYKLLGQFQSIFGISVIPISNSEPNTNINIFIT
jgi:hypothetical protein